jgi:four helix bundle protein
MLTLEVKHAKEANNVKENLDHVGPIRKHGDLLVYKQAYRLALAISNFTQSLPREEQFELGRQLRRSARSVAANIVEGWAKRNSAAEFKRHLLIASGEAAETRFWIELTVDEGLANLNAADALLREYAKLGFMIHNLWKERRKL